MSTPASLPLFCPALERQCNSFLLSFASLASSAAFSCCCLCHFPLCWLALVAPLLHSCSLLSNGLGAVSISCTPDVVSAVVVLGRSFARYWPPMFRLLLGLSWCLGCHAVLGLRNALERYMSRPGFAVLPCTTGPLGFLALRCCLLLGLGRAVVRYRPGAFLCSCFLGVAVGLGRAVVRYRPGAFLCSCFLGVAGGCSLHPGLSACLVSPVVPSSTWVPLFLDLLRGYTLLLLYWLGVLTLSWAGRSI